MTTRIFFEDTFDSAHWLPNVPVDHKCRNLHGHTYRVRVEIQGIIGLHTGWVIDHAEVKAIWEPIKRTIDHKCLNEIDDIQNSTCELLAQWIWNKLKDAGLNLKRLEVRETEHCGVVLEW